MYAIQNEWIDEGPLQRGDMAYRFNLNSLHIVWSRALDAEQCNTIHIVCLIWNFLFRSVCLVSITKATLIFFGVGLNAQ